MTTEQDVPLSFQGQFTFVHHDEDKKGRAANIKQKRAHVSGQYRNWQKRAGGSFVHVAVPGRRSSSSSTAPVSKDTHARQKALDCKTDLLALQQPPRIRRQQSRSDSDGDADDIFDSNPVFESSSLTVSTDSSDSSRSASVVLFATSSHPSSPFPCPVSILAQGNSDPFAAYDVYISPSVNSLLALFRDYIIPAIYGINVGRQALANQSARRRWNRMVEALNNTCLANAALAYHSSIRCLLRPDSEAIQQLALYSSRAVFQLRSNLVDMKTLSNDATKWQMTRLCEAALITRDPESSLVHLKMLHTILYNEYNNSVYDLDNFSTAICHDLHRSCMFMTGPIWDVTDAGWMMEVIDYTRETFVSTLGLICIPEASVDYSPNVDSSIGPELRSIFLFRREDLAWRARPISGFTHDSKMILSFYSWVVLRTNIIHGRLLNYHLKAVQTSYDHCICHYKRALSNGYEALQAFPTTCTCTHQLVQSLLSIAALYWSRNIHSEPRINGIALFETSSTLIPHLHQALARLSKHLLRMELLPHLVYMRVGHRPERFPTHLLNAILWSLYIGSQAEQREGRSLPPSGCKTRLPRIPPWLDLSKPSPLDHVERDDVFDESRTSPTPPSRGYFNSHFAAHAWAMGLSSWDQVRKVFEGFLYLDSFPLKGEHWFEGTMGAYLGRMGVRRSG